jgi:hypothetical protein
MSQRFSVHNIVLQKQLEMDILLISCKGAIPTG